MNNQLFTSDYKDEPYWWEGAPRPDGTDIALPQTADVAIIGSGYTGLNAAIQTARGGRDTVVIDAQSPGWGCSSRNGGQISTSLKHAYPVLARKYGEKLGYEIAREGHNALAWIGEFVAGEGIDCSFQNCGRFYGAHSPARFEALAQMADTKLPAGLETDSYVVPRGEQDAEIRSDLYHGGIVHPRHCSLDPGKYHLGLFELAGKAGARVVSNCAVTGIKREPSGFELQTAKGVIRARNVVIATSGYTGTITPWQRRRIIPIGSYIIATEPLDKALVKRLIPGNRMITDTRKLVVYYRACPERRRIIFGGRVSVSETDATRAAPALHAEMVRVFPELADTRISHAWMGFVGYTFDSMPHMGVHEGMHYSMGYCGSGVSLASYFGAKIGKKVLGLREGDSPLEAMTFETRPLYTGNPWFLAAAVHYYRWQDARG